MVGGHCNNRPATLRSAARIGATNLNLIIDTGSSISISPKKYTTGLAIQPTTIKLSSASGENIKCYGESIVEIKILTLRCCFTWTFVIADTSPALLGVDFLRKFDMMD